MKRIERDFGQVGTPYAVPFLTPGRSAISCQEGTRKTQHGNSRTGQLLNGPESDVVIESANWRYVIEAKWRSDTSIHKHGETQLEMRAGQASAGIPAGQWGVIAIAPGPSRYIGSDAPAVFCEYFRLEGEGYLQRDRAKELNAKAIIWERLSDIIGDRGGPQLPAYLDWRLRNFP